MEVEFEADDAGFQQAWQWLATRQLWPFGLYIRLLTSAPDHRRNVRLTGATIRARGKAIYVADFSEEDDALLFKLNFWGSGIIRFLKD